MPLQIDPMSIRLNNRKARTISITKREFSELKAGLRKA
jgi:hypothetical protein